MTTNLIARFGFPALVGAAFVLGGCAGNSSLTGRVIPGPGNVVTVLETADPRFKDEGIGETSIVVRRFVAEGQNGPIIGTGVSDQSGEFKIPITDKDAERYQMVLTATTTDKRISRGRIYFPAEGKEVLVIVRDLK
ncbi:MAG: hypothetical protein KF805_02045 [Phycisphaeraceae bacterium]|nr:hypothetical protein [Phycisphaeraceae bacterium]